MFHTSVETSADKHASVSSDGEYEMVWFYHILLHIIYCMVVVFNLLIYVYIFVDLLYFLLLPIDG